MIQESTVNDLLERFQAFVTAASPELLDALRELPEFYKSINILYSKAPTQAPALAHDLSSRRETTLTSPDEKALEEPLESEPLRRRKRRPEDSTYQPSNGVRASSKSAFHNVEPIAPQHEPMDQYNMDKEVEKHSESADNIVGDDNHVAAVAGTSPHVAPTDLNPPTDQPLPTSDLVCLAEKSLAHPSGGSMGLPAKEVRCRDTDSSQPMTTAVIVEDAVYTIYCMHNYLSRSPMGDNLASFLRRLHQEASKEEPAEAEWSDGAMWSRMITIADHQRQLGTFCTLLAYGGFANWFDKQIETTLKIQPDVTQKLASTMILNKLQGQTLQPHHTSKSVLGGEISAGEEAQGAQGAQIGNGGMPDAQKSGRKRFNVVLSRGRKLNNIVLSELGRGAFLYGNIWKLVKTTDERLRTEIQRLKSEEKRMQLFQALELQSDLVMSSGRPDFGAFLQDLEDRKVISEHDHYMYKRSYVLDSVSLPAFVLVAAVDDLRDELANKVFGKPKLDDEDSFTIDGKLDVGPEILKTFEPDEWLTSWAVVAGMQTIDRPSNVQLHASEMLKQPSKKTKSLPFLCKSLRESVAYGKGHDQIHLMPLNHNDNHFTLLEINRKEKTIYHFDSLHSADRLEGTRKIVQQALKFLKYAYADMDCPQQLDSFSCGLMVIWCAAHRANGLSPGAKGDVVDANRYRLEIVNALKSSVTEGAMHKRRRDAEPLGEDDMHKKRRKED